MRGQHRCIGLLFNNTVQRWRTGPIMKASRSHSSGRLSPSVKHDGLSYSIRYLAKIGITTTQWHPEPDGGAGKISSVYFAVVTFFFQRTASRTPLISEGCDSLTCYCGQSLWDSVVVTEKTVDFHRIALNQRDIVHFLHEAHSNDDAITAKQQGTQTALEPCM